MNSGDLSLTVICLFKKVRLEQTVKYGTREHRTDSNAIGVEFAPCLDCAVLQFDKGSKIFRKGREIIDIWYKSMIALR